MAIPKFKLADVQNDLYQIVMQSQKQNQKQPGNIVQSLLERAKAKREVK